MNTLTISLEEAEDLLDGVSSRFEEVERDWHEDHRWHTTWRLIFRDLFVGDFYELFFDLPATEMQEGMVLPFESYVDSNDHITCHRVFRTIVTVIQYERAPA